MKLHLCFLLIQKSLVAPPVGAWIEIRNFGRLQICSIVAPPVGAWIEINLIPTHLSKGIRVAPPVGAWIEMILLISMDKTL